MQAQEHRRESLEARVRVAHKLANEEAARMRMEQIQQHKLEEARKAEVRSQDSLSAPACSCLCGACTSCRYWSFSEDGGA